MKEKLQEIYDTKKWNKYVEVEGEKYIYNSTMNEFRKLVHQPSGDINVIVGFMMCGNVVLVKDE